MIVRWRETVHPHTVVRNMDWERYFGVQFQQIFKNVNHTYHFRTISFVRVYPTKMIVQVHTNTHTHTHIHFGAAYKTNKTTTKVCFFLSDQILNSWGEGQTFLPPP